ncbi:MAG TPA: DsbA family protein [Nitrospirota bacterium]|nr:DsbA family protein [Nitrospirota bacterium]
MGKGLVERLRQEFDLRVEWLSVEIHPDTPPEGMPIEQMFRAQDTKRMMKNLREMGAVYGIIFSDITRISNSRLAIQAAEFSRDQGRFDAFHDAVLQAYFAAGLDIGDREVILQLGKDTGLDVQGLEKALNEGTYLPRLKEMQDEAAKAGVTGVPTFVLGSQKTIVGAQPIEVFRKALSSIKNS